uniref:Uncharacterized protein n=1 Tax=Opuntia streptacantha TaxID=393608 RepID=A0A7C8YSF8_OPUST
MFCDLPVAGGQTQRRAEAPTATRLTSRPSFLSPAFSSLRGARCKCSYDPTLWMESPKSLLHIYNSSLLRLPGFLLVLVFSLGILGLMSNLIVVVLLPKMMMSRSL